MVHKLFSLTREPAHVLLSMEAADRASEFYVREAKGASARKLTTGTSYGPYPIDQAREALESLRIYYLGLGYSKRGRDNYLLLLQEKDRKQRAHAAVQLGWRKPEGALEALLKAAAEATTEISSIMDALGRLSQNDARVTALLIEQSQKKLLSRRRSAVEAMRALGLEAELKQAIELGWPRFSSEVSELLRNSNQQSLDNVQLLSSKLNMQSATDLGLALDQLYEINTPLTRAALMQLLLNQAWIAGRFRYTKSILKRACLRSDAEVIAAITRGFELTRPPLLRADIKSGLDGQQKETIIYSQRTRSWCLRMVARHFKRLGAFEPARYVQCAAQFLSHYKPVQNVQEAALMSFDSAVVLHSVLYTPQVLKTKGYRKLGSYTSRAPIALQLTKLPYAELWQKKPNTLAKLLKRCAFMPLQRAIEVWFSEHPLQLQQLDVPVLCELLDSPALRALAAQEAQRRFDPAQPDIALLQALLDGQAAARSLGLSLLEQSKHSWAANPDLINQLLSRDSTDVQMTLADLMIRVLNEQSVDQRQRILFALLDPLLEGEMESHAGRLQVIEHFAAEYQSLPSEQLLLMVDMAAPAVQTAASAILAAIPNGAELIGLAKVLRMADSNLPSVRKHAIRLAEQLLPELAKETYGLLRLADGRFADTRSGAFALIQRIDFAAFGFEGVLSLCDSNQDGVQKFARDWVRLNFSRIDQEALMFKLIEHPHARMQQFAVELIEQKLPPGVSALMRVQQFLRAVLRRPRMARRSKDGVIHVLIQRAHVDEPQAKLVLAIFNDSLRTATRADREPLLVGLSQIQLRYPALESDWQIAKAAS